MTGPFSPPFRAPFQPPGSVRHSGGLTLPRAGLLEYWRKDGTGNLVATIGLLITNDQVRTELMALFFYGATKYDDATIAANIAASSGLLNMYELIGDGDIAYALYAIGTPQATLNRAIRYFYSRALFVNSEPLFIDGEILEVA